MSYTELDLSLPGSNNSVSPTNNPYANRIFSTQNAAQMANDLDTLSLMNHLPAQFCYLIFFMWSFISLHGPFFISDGVVIGMMMASGFLAYIIPMLFFNFTYFSIGMIPVFIYIDPTYKIYGYLVFTLGKFIAFICSWTIGPIFWGFFERVGGI